MYNIVPNGAIRDHTGPYGPYRTIRSIRDHTRPYNPTEPYRSIGIHMNQYGQNSVSLSEFMSEFEIHQRDAYATNNFVKKIFCKFPAAKQQIFIL